MSAGAGSDFDSNQDDAIHDPWAKFAHFLYDKGLLEYHTEIPNPDAQTFLDSAADHWGKTLSPNVGKYVRAAQVHKRVNMVAFNRERAKETERIAKAKAEDEKEERKMADVLTGKAMR